MENYLSYLGRIVNHKRIVGLDILINNVGIESIHGIIIERKRHSIKILQQIQSCNSIDSLKNIIPQNYPISICINGRSVFTKKVGFITDDINKSFQSAFPEAVPSIFSSELIQGHESSIISIMRKEVLENIVNQFTLNGYYLSKVHFAFNGLSSAIQVESIGPELPAILKTGFWEIKKLNTFIVDFKEEFDSSIAHDIYKIGNEIISGNMVLPLCASISLALNRPQNINGHESIEASTKNFTLNQIFKRSSISLLVFLFVLLFINSIFFVNFRNSIIEQNSMLESHNGQLQTIDTLQKGILKNKYFINQNKLLKISHNSQIMDDLAASIIDGISLEKINICPIENNLSSQKNKRIQFKDAIIRVVGTSQRSLYLNQWIKNLSLLSWVKKTNILPYAEDKAGKGFFELEIIMQ